MIKKINSQLIIALVSLSVSVVLFCFAGVSHILMSFASLAFGISTITFGFIFRDNQRKQIERYESQIRAYVTKNNIDELTFSQNNTLKQMYKNRKKYIKQMRFSLFVLLLCGAALIVVAFLYLIL